MEDSDYFKPIKTTQLRFCLVKEYSLEYDIFTWRMKVIYHSDGTAHALNLNGIEVSSEVLAQGVNRQYFIINLTEALQSEAHPHLHSAIEGAVRGIINKKSHMGPHQDIYGYGQAVEEDMMVVIPREFTPALLTLHDNNIVLETFYSPEFMASGVQITFFEDGIKDSLHHKSYVRYISDELITMTPPHEMYVWNEIYHDLENQLNSVQRANLVNVMKGKSYSFMGQALSEMGVAVANATEAFNAFKPYAASGRPPELSILKDILQVTVEYPCLHNLAANNLESVIIHLNDSDKWTREQIADWIDELHVSGIVDTTIKSPNEDQA